MMSPSVKALGALTRWPRASGTYPGPTRCWSKVSEELVAALRRYPPEVLLAEFGARLAMVRNPEISRTLLHLIGLTLGVGGADLIREDWERFSEMAYLPGLAFAASRCLPVAEGHRKVTDALARLDLRNRMDAKTVLLEFTTPLTLDWVETTVRSPVDITWGLLAASSDVDWPRAKDWLARGRPHSLVALDALEWCMCSGRKPPLLNPPEPSELEERLQEYRSRDPVVRVREKVGRLLESIRPSAHPPGSR